MNLIIVCGATGEGKSNYVNKMLLHNSIKKVQGKDNYFVSTHSRRQYIFDLNNEYNFPTDNNILPQMRNVDLNVKKFLSISKHLQNTNIVLEDATGFFRGRQHEDFIQQIVSKRHTGNNFILLYHAIRTVPPELMVYCNYFVIFKTGDDLWTVNNRLHNNAVNAAFLKVQNAKKFSKQIIKIV